MEDIVKIISSSNNNTNRFTPTGDGDLDIDKVRMDGRAVEIGNGNLCTRLGGGERIRRKQKVIKDGLYYEAKEKIEVLPLKLRAVPTSGIILKLMYTR